MTHLPPVLSRTQFPDKAIPKKTAQDRCLFDLTDPISRQSHPKEDRPGPMPLRPHEPDPATFRRRKSLNRASPTLAKPRNMAELSRSIYLLPKRLFSRLFFLSLTASLTLSATAELPGGPITVRPAVVTDKGALPRVVVQTVADSEVTATSLILRYRENSKLGPSPSAAHLLEHLQYRSQPKGKPGGLLVRNELLGGESKAWVRPNLIQFSELVPSSEGLNSLQIQLERLRGIPKDPQDIAIERNTVLWESKTANKSPIENGRREILTALGVSPEVEGDTEELSRLDTDDLQALLEGLSIEDDVVISIVGPHSPRQVRKHLSRHFAPVLPARKDARESLQRIPVQEKTVKVRTVDGHPQTSYFLRKEQLNRNTFWVAQALLEFTNSSESQAHLHRESRSIYRLDLCQPNSDSPQLPSLDEKARVEFLEDLRRNWFARWESPQTRAEMLAESALFGETLEGPVTAATLPKFLGQATSFLREAYKSNIRLEVAAEKQNSSPAKLFEFQETANYDGPQGIQRQKLPNGLEITWVGRSSWPIVAISGFSKIRIPLNSQQALQLNQILQRRSKLGLDYEVKDGGLFFHGWTERENLQQYLQDCAQEIKALAESDEIPLSKQSLKSGVLETFFDSGSAIRTRDSVRGRELFDPKDTQLVLVGDIDTIALDRGIRPAWSGWFQKSLPKSYPANDSNPKPHPLENQTIEQAKDSQAILVIGFDGPSRTSPDFLAFNLALQTLAGRPTTSVLARQLRDEQKMVQSVKLFPIGQASLQSQGQDSRQPWLIALRMSESHRDPVQLTSLIRAQLNQLAQEPLANSDIDRTRTYLKSRLSISASTLRGQARIIAHAEYYRLAESYSTDYAGLYDHLTPKQVQETCTKYFSTPKLRWVFFKPKE